MLLYLVIRDAVTALKLSTLSALALSVFLIQNFNQISPLWTIICHSSSFTAKCYAIIEALTTIYKFPQNKYLIAFDSLPYLLSLKCNPFNFQISSFILCIKIIIFHFHQSNYIIQFLWVPHIWDSWQWEVADKLIRTVSNYICSTLL